ncbi:hypothetical protein NPIL_12791 [Nephila pilipes]|uniref:Uncharacterized protein n=1 Tax=Nephila pilipes TaxID=299642 RepID=A0A8X6PPW8_NEPPI|nr:hypothetical protein NPIL_12791 [Nephila pilipes]
MARQKTSDKNRSRDRKKERSRESDEERRHRRRDRRISAISSPPVVSAFRRCCEADFTLSPRQPKVIRELSLVRWLSGRLRALDHNPIRPLKAGS